MSQTNIQPNLFLTKKRLAAILICAACLWFLFTGFLTIVRYRANYASTYDFGIFSQMYYYMDQTLAPMTTCERDGLLSHFAVHLSPIFLPAPSGLSSDPQAGNPSGPPGPSCGKRHDPYVSVGKSFPPFQLGNFRIYLDVLLIPCFYGRLFLRFS